MEIVSISDIHIGTNRLSPDIIHRNICECLYPELNKELDILFFGGDFWHTLLNLNSPSAFIALTIIDEILDLSIKNDFLIYVLDGTFEHDRDMNKLFLRHKDKYPNVKIIETMTVEYVEKYNIHVLFIPDDLPYKNAQSEAIKRIKEKGLEKVDICCLHGFCKHEIPKDVPIEPYNLFDADYLERFVKGPIIKGHIHVKSIHGKTINNGSFERWTHGEEGSKGFFRIKYDKIDSFTYQFIENKNTGLFKTIKIPNENFVESFINQVEKIIKKIDSKTPLPINIRITCNKEVKNKFNPYDFDFNTPIKFTFKLLDSIETHEDDIFLINLDDLVSITKENLPELISEFIGGKLSSQEIKEILNTED